MNRFTKLLATIALTLVVTPLFAQETPKKETVIVDFFTRSLNVPANYSDGVRNGVIHGFTSKGRFIVIDAATDSKLQDLNKNRKTEDAVDASNVLDESRSAAIKSMGAKYLITGTSTNYSTKSESKDGKTTHTSKILFSLKGHDIITGEVVATKEFEAIGFGEVKAEADNNAIKDVSGKMSTFVNEYFPFYTKILELGEKKGKKLKELYIQCGTTMGVKIGDQFAVMLEVSRGGVRSLKEIAKLRVTEVEGEEVSKCTVTSGGDVLSENYNSEIPKVLIVKSKGHNALAGLVGGFKL